MWSFFASVALFFALLVFSALWQRRHPRPPDTAVDEDIHKAAEIAQRRHRKKYGREDTGLHRTLQGMDGQGGRKPRTVGKA